MSDKRHESSEFDRGRIVGAHDADMSERQIVEMYGFQKPQFIELSRVLKNMALQNQLQEANDLLNSVMR